jgi:hypothetical protein
MFIPSGSIGWLQDGLLWTSLAHQFSKYSSVSVLIIAEAGVGLSAIGGMTLLLGCVMLFNRGILAIGNVNRVVC